MNLSNNVNYFGAGPAMLPIEVKEQLAKDVISYSNSGISILEIPHRSKYFGEIIDECNSLVLDLLSLSSNEYEVLWLQGGGRQQFAMIPMCFLDKTKTAAYVDSGHWANLAHNYATYYGKAVILASSKTQNYLSLPTIPEVIAETFTYIHVTSNNTIYGTQIQQLPNFESPLVVDMSSDIFSKNYQYTNADIIYAVAQKNFGIAGLTMVVLKKKWLDKVSINVPPIFNYKQHAIHKSVLNTPPVFAIYTSLLYLRWLKQIGTQKIFEVNQKKAKLIYEEIEHNKLFSCDVKKEDRSIMNIVFKAHNQKIEAEFLKFSEINHIKGIKGHRSVGGFRISMYNAVCIEQAAYLVDVFKQFEKQYI